MFAQRLGLPNLRGTRSFVVATFIDFLGTGLFLPFSLLYFTRAVGLPLPAVGLALSIAMTITLPLVPVTGLLIDRFGTRRVVLLAQFLQGAGFLGYLVVRNVPMLLGMVLLNAIGQRLFWSAYFTLMAEIAAPHERDRWYGLGAATRNAGLGLGGLLAGVVVGANAILGYHLVVIADALSFFLAAGLLLFGVRVTSPQRSDGPQRSGYKLILRDRAFLVLVAANVIFALCSLMLGIGVPVYVAVALRAPLWVIGVIMALSTALIAVFQTVVVRVLEPFRRTRVLILTGWLWCAWCSLLVLALLVPRAFLIPFLFIVTCVYALAELIHDPTSNALAADIGQESLRGRYLALFQLSWSVAGLIAPGLFAVLFTLRPVLPWLVMATLILLASLTIHWIEPHLPRQAVRRQ
ncbi:MAG: MFS transporter [Ktedonobacteraceae bacterium]